MQSNLVKILLSVTTIYKSKVLGLLGGKKLMPSQPNSNTFTKSNLFTDYSTINLSHPWHIHKNISILYILTVYPSFQSKFVQLSNSALPRYIVNSEPPLVKNWKSVVPSTVVVFASHVKYYKYFLSTDV